jgi:fimbrial chaperone protein
MRIRGGFEVLFRKPGLAACIAGLMLTASPADAARVAPMSIDLTPTGSGSVARIEVSNAEDRVLPMEVRMYRGVITEDGRLDLEPADDRFIVFPPQIVLQPQTQQVFRIQYIPDAELTQSEVYYASVSQVPVNIEPTESRIQVLMRFNVLVNVVPSGTAPEPTISWARSVVRESRLPDDPNLSETDRAQVHREQGVEVRIENRGTRYYAAGRNGWTITGTDESGAAFSQSFTQAQISDKIGMGVVAPGRARVFFLPIDRPLREGSVNVTLNR